MSLFRVYRFTCSAAFAWSSTRCLRRSFSSSFTRVCMVTSRVLCFTTRMLLLALVPGSCGPALVWRLFPALFFVLRTSNTKMAPLSAAHTYSCALV